MFSLGDPDMLSQIFRITVCILGGAAAAYSAGIWQSRLMRERGLKGELSVKAKRIVYAVMAICGGFAGMLTEGVFSPLCVLTFLGICCVIAVMDVQFRVIPNQTLLALIGLKLISGLASLAGLSLPVPFDVVQSLLGLFVCFAVFVLPGFFGKNVGAGDVKLAAVMGFFLGLWYSLLGIMAMGLAVIAYTVIQRRAPFLRFVKTMIPMGPFITAGMFLVLVGAPLIG